MKVEYFDYKEASGILKRKNLYTELNEILRNLSEIDHCKIQKALLDRGWRREEKIVPWANWQWDACKDKVIVSIEFSQLDAVHRDFFRLLMWHQADKVDAMIYITTTFKEPKFPNVKRDIENISRSNLSLLPVPILLVGLGP